MKIDGYAIIQNFIPPSLVSHMIAELERCYAVCRDIQIRNGIENSEGTCHHLAFQSPVFLECLETFEGLNLEEYFGGKYILNSYGGNILTGTSYASAIHRDQRSFSSDNLMLNTIVTLDDFTQNNGATWLMDRGHLCPETPSQKQFDKYKFQAIAPAGSLVMFNSNLWHAAGINTTSAPRRSITPIFSRPFIKPGFDYPRVMGYYSDEHSPYLRQVLGYNARIPCTLGEWYQTERFYKGDQG